jgi:hypothetical protein
MMMRIVQTHHLKDKRHEKLIDAHRYELRNKIQPE